MISGSDQTQLLDHQYYFSFFFSLFFCFFFFSPFWLNLISGFVEHWKISNSSMGKCEYWGLDSYVSCCYWYSLHPKTAIITIRCLLTLVSFCLDSSFLEIFKKIFSLFLSGSDINRLWFRHIQAYSGKNQEVNPDVVIITDEISLVGRPSSSNFGFFVELLSIPPSAAKTTHFESPTTPIYSSPLELLFNCF